MYFYFRSQIRKIYSTAGLVMERYEKYKNSGIDWIGEIPEYWEIQKLKHFVVKVGSGITPKGGADVYQLKGIPLLRSQNVYFDGLKLDDVAYISEKIHDEMSNSKVIDGDVLLNITGGSIGRCFYVDDNLGEANVNQHVCIVRPAQNISTKFLYYVLNSNLGQKQIDIEQTGSGREGLNFESLKNFLVPFIGSEEQKAIARFLDRKTAEIDQLIAQKKRLIELYEEEKTAIINQAVTKGINPDVKLKPSGIDWLGDIPEHWTLTKLGRLSNVTKLTGFEYTKKWITDPDGEIIALRGFNIKKNQLVLDNVEKISSKLSRELFRSKLYAGDIVFPCTGTLGEGAIIDEDNRYHINQNIAKLSPKHKLDSKFLLFSLCSNSMKYQIDIYNTSGLQPVLLIGTIRDLLTLIPPLKEQKAIARYIETETARIDAKIAKTKRIIELQKEYRTALISEAVTGKIKVPELAT